LDSFLEPKRYEPKSNVPRILLLIALLAALGGAGWWTYTNYLGAAKVRIPAPAVSSASDAGSPQVVPPSASVPEEQPDPASAGSGSAPEMSDTPANPTTKPVIPEKPAPPKPAPAKPAAVKPAVAQPKIPRIALGDKSAEVHEHKPASAKPVKAPAPAAPDLGDADLRKGEAYLYGLGVKENCDEAIKYLKAASAKSNVKSRSTFGTMYATGHCVARDLPTAYSWFALALRTDPNNQVLEKDLSQLWTQMTPSERQVAIKTKP
jgi:cytoskeletal protein RodZ